MLDSEYDHEVGEGSKRLASDNISKELERATQPRDSAREMGKLWASDLGKPCLRQHYYKFNDPTKGAKLSGNTKFKFLYGNILEEAVLYYAREAGHAVSEEQTRVEVDHNGWAISGRIDAVIDNVLVDVKSTSSFGFKRYKDGINPSNDSFGYLEQLGFYKNFGDFSVADQGFVWVDKQNGHIKYTPCAVPTKDALLRRVDDVVGAIESSEHSVPRGFSPAPYGKSGNESLPISCSYCDFKKHCWRDSNGGKGLRGFVYNQGPVWFTKVVREPNVPEIKDE